MNDDRLVRAIAFERELLRRTSTRVERFEFGEAYFHDALPHRWSSNMLWVDTDVRPSVDELVAEADRLLGEAGLRHRKVNADGENGRSLAAGFLELGWTVHRLLVMALGRQPDRAPAIAVEHVPFATVRPIVELVSRRTEMTEDEAALQQLVGHKAVVEEGVGAAFFVARVDRELAGVCELYVADGVAQIEDVNTLEEHRGRGVARAIVLAAAEVARDQGADLVFLVADDDDWPKHLYRRLGFDPVGPEWEFLRTPAG